MAKLAARTPMIPAPETAPRRSSAAIWWLAAALSVIAVAVAILLLSGARPSPGKAQAVREPGKAATPIDSAALGSRLAAPHAAGSSEAATTSKAKATEAAAQAGAASADVAKQDVATAEPGPR
jgi:hypothetical protein